MWEFRWENRDFWVPVIDITESLRSWCDKVNVHLELTEDGFHIRIPKHPFGPTSLNYRYREV